MFESKNRVLLGVCCAVLFSIARRQREMLTMEQIEAAIYQKMKISGKQMESMQGVERELTMEGEQREHIIRWFVDTQAVLLLCDGSFPPWFKGFISRQEAEDRLKDTNVGCFLIRLSEKGIGYILSYKGQDRCRHFVIHQTQTGQLIVSGDSTTHNSLTELIDHFKTTPIQPFGEYLTSEAESIEKDPKNDIYDEFHIKPHITLGVSVRALRSLWEQASDVHHETSPDPPSKTSRKLTTSTSIDEDSLSQAIRIPTLPKKNPPLRNSLSVDFAGSHPCHDQQSFSEPTTSGKTGVEERDGSGRRDSWDPEDCDSQLKRPENSNIPPIQTNPTNWLLPIQDENTEESQTLSFEPCNPAASGHPQPSTVSPSSSYAFLAFKKAHTGDDQLPHTGQIALQSNPLYQEVHAEKEVQPMSDYDNPTMTNYKTLSAENTYQVIPDQCENDTYEHIPEIHRSNTGEDVPESDSNTYASLEEMQPYTEKKNHKWWKLRSESKKK